MNEFWPRFGGDMHLPKSTVNLMLTDARQYYTGLPYHNFGHALSTLWRSMELADLCEANGTPVNRPALASAAPIHDAGLHHSSDRRAVDARQRPVSDEIHATHIMKSLWHKYGIGLPVRQLAEQAVLATAPDGPDPIAIEDKILVRADIDNVGGNFDQSFMRAALLLREEVKILADLRGEKAPSDMQFFTSSIVTIATYLQKDLSLGDFDSEWSAHALFNLRRLAHNVVTSEARATSQLIQSLGKGAVRQLLNISPLD